MTVVTRAECVIPGCIKPNFGHGWCNMHYARWRRNGDPLAANRVFSSPPPIIEYGGIHIRLKKSFGSAANYLCIDCGNQAQEWSYTHDDPNEMVSRKNGCLYSIYPEYYTPRCVSCHRSGDRGRTWLI